MGPLGGEGMFCLLGRGEAFAFYNGKSRRTNRDRFPHDPSSFSLRVSGARGCRSWLDLRMISPWPESSGSLS